MFTFSLIILYLNLQFFAKHKKVVGAITPKISGPLYKKCPQFFRVFFLFFFNFFVLEAGHSPRSPTLRFSRYYKYAASIMSEKTCLSTFESGWFHCAQHYICVYISTPHFKAVYDFFFFFYAEVSCSHCTSFDIK